MVSYFMLLWMERARGWPNRSFDGSVLFGGGMGGGGEGGYGNGRSPHGKLCPLGQTESAQASRYKRDVWRAEHQVPGIDDALYANAGSRLGVLYCDARSRLREAGPTDFILLTGSLGVSPHFGT